ncbi:MAG TPA: TetR/AcrR family transcriptional regulator [Chloroflexaceae bacterium]|nr:TetR/AcrR family transcriptional regulator [Chloroflexaceae bacterium]
MPPRDEQDYEQRRQQIIDGALEAFSARGFEGASNKAIAEAAGIASPGLIYHYFKDKVDLLHQVMIERLPVLRLLDEVQRIMELPPDEALPQLAERMIEVYSRRPAMAIIKVAIAESLRNKRVAHMVSEAMPGRGLRMLSAYLARQMEAGRLRRMDPDIAARMLVGPIVAYAVTRFVFEQPEAQAISPEAMARATVETFLRGMAPE